ncbi:MoaD/ThiS family protein [Archaeoglobus profundus]|uniref:MoaD family protein n=1 Tax=Archaeoglobus profundus (strain DSM 5631 / JCM 9629 / NBRC 100127 / Av18) TaxID=572546 RepID=D2RGC9_ARCPA|nr:MoaD/ThiS family protein [Archaeoglobus profundus]ADB57354.1 MoaD family protein [Archaeoglobus profundus DSM 5631]
MRVKVQLFATLRRFGKEFEVEGNSLEEILKKLAERLGEEFYREIFDENGKIRSDRIITVDGRNIKDERPKLKEGSVIAIFPPIAGG